MLSWLLFSPLFISVLGKAFNATVDDAATDSPMTSGSFIQYSNGGSEASNKWISSTDACDTCTAKPRADLVFNGTWHDATYDPTINTHVPLSASFSFQGTGVYVYFILSLTSTSPVGHVSCSFSLDGQIVKNYTFNPPKSSGYLYDQLVFSQSDLTNSTHTLVINNNAPDGKRSLILLDKIVWTGDDGLPAKTEGAQGMAGITTGALIGITVGAVLFLITVGTFTAWFIWRRRRRDLNPRKDSGNWRGTEAAEMASSSYPSPSEFRTPTDSNFTHVYPEKLLESGIGSFSETVPPPAYRENDSEVVSVYSRIRSL